MLKIYAHGRPDPTPKEISLTELRDGKQGDVGGLLKTVIVVLLTKPDGRNSSRSPYGDSDGSEDHCFQEAIARAA